MTRSLVAVAWISMLLVWGTFRGQSGRSLSAEHVVFVADDLSAYLPGCEAISAIDSRSGDILARGEYNVSPGRLTGTSDGSLALAVSNNGGRFVYALRRSSDPSRWRTVRIEKRQLIVGAPPAISPDDRVLLLSTLSGLEKYAVAGISDQSLGLSTGLYAELQSAAIIFSGDSRSAFAADTDGYVHIIDVERMTPRHDPVPYRLVSNRSDIALRNTNAALSPDGRYLVLNGGAVGYVNVIDLHTYQSQAVPVSGLKQTWGVAFNHASTNHGLLAVHGLSAVAIYEFRAGGRTALIASVPVPPQKNKAPQDQQRFKRQGALAWTGDGTAVVAAIGGTREFRILDYVEGETPPIRPRLDFDSCETEIGRGFQTDVYTVNRGLAPPPTPTATACPTPSPTRAAVDTPVPTLSPSATATRTPTPTPTRVPQPIYLPLLLKEECDPTHLQADVALVIDASTSMLEETRDKRTKLAAAIEAVELFLGQLNLPLDQAAVIQFNEGAALLQELTGDRRALVESLDRVQVKRQTRIDLGIQVAREELKSSRRRPGNQAVMIVLTDGKANPVGPDAAVREAQTAKADKITIFTIGLGEDLNLAALEAMASKPAYFYRAPDGEDLKEIYAAIAVEIPCPATDFWGLR